MRHAAAICVAFGLTAAPAGAFLQAPGPGDPAPGLPSCAAVSDYEVARARYGVTATDGAGMLVGARSANKKWGVSTAVDAAVFGGENWFALDGLKHTVCGPLRSSSIMGHALSGSEADVHFHLRPAAPYDALVAALEGEGLRTDRCQGERCLYSEITPHRALEDLMCAGRTCVEGGAFTGAAWRCMTDACVTGPLVLERFHAYVPEIHPAEVSWGAIGPDTSLLMLIRDASRRFDQPKYFSPWPDVPVLPWSDTRREQNAAATFDLWFSSTPGEDVRFEVEPIGAPSGAGSAATLVAGEGVRIGVGGAQGLAPTATAVCTAGDRIVSRLSLTLKAAQRRHQGEDGRKGRSEAAVVLVRRIGGSAIAPADAFSPPRARCSAQVPLAAPTVGVASEELDARRYGASTGAEVPLVLRPYAWVATEKTLGGAEPQVLFFDATVQTEGSESGEDVARIVDEINVELRSRKLEKAGFHVDLDLMASAADGKPASVRYRAERNDMAFCTGPTGVVSYWVAPSASTILGAGASRPGRHAVAFKKAQAVVFGSNGRAVPRPDEHEPLVELHVCTPPGVRVTARIEAGVTLPERPPLTAMVERTVPVDCQGEGTPEGVLASTLPGLGADPATIEALQDAGVRLRELADGDSPRPEDLVPRAAAARSVHAMAMNLAADCPTNLPGSPSGRDVLGALYRWYVKLSPRARASRP